MGDATGGPKGGEAAFLFRQPETCPAPGSEHNPTCPGGRTEEVDVDGPHGSRWRTSRCVECGASQATPVVPAKRLSAGTPEYARAWRLERTRIRRQLTTEEQLLDPVQNPLHPDAEPHAPVFTGGDDGRERLPWPHFPGDQVR